MKWFRAYFQNPFLKVLLLICMACFAFHFLVMQQFGFPIGLSWKDALGSTLLLLILSLSSLLLYAYYQPGERNWYYRLLFPLASAGLFVWIHRWIWMGIGETDTERPPFSDAVSSLRFVFVFLVLSMSSLMAWFYHLMDEQRRQLNRKRESEQLAKDAELMLIRQQLQPHFLFNSLNSISSLVSSAPIKAREMIVKLSDLFRITLQGQRQGLVKLEEEIKYMELYLDMERMRFGPNLSFISKVEPDALQTLVPAMLLQPLLENALKYSRRGKDKTAVIEFNAIHRKNVLLLEFRNEVDEEEVLNSKGAGFGLQAVKRRLFLIYGRNDLLQYTREAGIFDVKVHIPLNTPHV